MEHKERIIIKSVTITAAAFLGGMMAFILPGQLGIMSPDKWYDDPLVLIVIGLIIGGIVGWCVNLLVGSLKKIVDRTNSN
jgi:hypothetical protein